MPACCLGETREVLGRILVAVLGVDRLTVREPDRVPGNVNLLFAPASGAVGPDGKAWATPETIRNTAMTIYRLPLLSQGFKGRPK